jgi:hypothetical protein
MDAGPPFCKANWKPPATVSHAAWMIISKLMDDGKLMKRYRVEVSNK